MKKVIALMLIIAVLTLIVACDPSSKKTETTASIETTAETTTATEEETTTTTTTTATTEPPVPVDPLAEEKEAAKQRAYDIIKGCSYDHNDIVSKFDLNYKVYDIDNKIEEMVSPNQYYVKDGVSVSDYGIAAGYSIIEGGYMFVVVDQNNKASSSSAQVVPKDYKITILNAFANDYFASGAGSIIVKLYADDLKVEDITVDELCTKCYYPDYYTEMLFGEPRDNEIVEHQSIYYSVADDAVVIEQHYVEEFVIDENETASGYLSILLFIKGIAGEEGAYYKNSILLYTDSTRNDIAANRTVSLSDFKFVDDTFVGVHFEIINSLRNENIEEGSEISKIVNKKFGDEVSEEATFDVSDPDAPLFDIVIKCPINTALYGLPITATQISSTKIEKKDDGKLILTNHMYIESSFTLIAGDGINFTGTLVYNPEDLPEIPSRVLDCVKKAFEDLKKQKEIQE